MDPKTSPETFDDNQLTERLQQARDAILTEIRKLIIGQDETIELVMIALFTGGHCLITGVPGLAKTLLIRTLATILDLDFKRIQFTPDLMPADITGIDVIEEDRTTGKRIMKFIKGPLFANIILADEINRTPPKTQAALLEAMQEHHITAGGVTYHLEEPFFVLATQNPIELEGTYPLPEAQLDRFMFNLVMDYLPEEHEVQVATTTTGNLNPTLKQVVSGPEVRAFQSLVRKVFVSQEVARYAVQLVRATRPTTPNAPDFVKNWVNWGAGLRASQYLILGSKARAVLRGRVNVSVKDIQALALPVLRHRVLTNFFAESEKVKAEDIIKRLLELTPTPKSGLS
ncbi:MoxR family ATPase [bacterium]|nr:MAG: MoxR family ATPase [candidate division KSB1 bacterium]MCE7944289.1 MoxR family ATPase [Chlorobi bacterium CHB1]MCL4705328.1 MoxR family ATPase [bacterium]MDL1877683.1 MoxR family ATPase [Cytophagia bacterium CHB2]